MPRRGIFLDRDGVLCENLPTYVKSWAEFRWLPAALGGMHVLARVGLPVIMVTNQSVVNRGLTTLASVASIHARMRAEIEQSGGRLDAIYECPHRPDEGCNCRKPGALLFRRAAAEWSLDLGSSYLIGDSRADLHAGWNLGMTVLLVRTGLGKKTEAELDGQRRGVLVVSDLMEAAQWIRAQETSLGPDAMPVPAMAVPPHATSLPAGGVADRQ